MVVRIAVASTPLTATLAEAVPAAVAAIEEAGRLRAAIVCLPEAAVPGHRVQARTVPEVAQAALDAAIAQIADAARHARVVAIVGTERLTVAGREIVSVVIDADGSLLGEQAKTQIDPTEEVDYVPGAGRRVFTAGGVTFGIAICHEAFRYPEIARSLAVAGAQVVFVPHFVTTDDGSLPTAWCDPGQPLQREGRDAPGAREHGLRGCLELRRPDQGSLTGIIAPDGRLVAGLAYGEVGVVAADLDLELATRLLALRWAPERNVIANDVTSGRRR